MLKVTTIVVCLLLGLSIQAQILPNFGGQRAGISTLSFLKNDLNPQSIGMSGASVALNGNSFSNFSNPAGLSNLEHNSIAASHLILGAGVQQSYLGLYRKLKNEGTLGLAINSLNSGAMKVRTEFQPNGTGKLFYVNYTALGVNYAQKLSEMFNVGLAINYIYESLAEYKNHTATVNIGFMYETDFKELKFAVNVQNFGGNSSLTGDVLPVDFNRPNVTLDDYTVPTVFKMGFSFIPYFKNKNQLLVSAQLNNPNDNSENLRFGFAYDYAKIIQVQTGYKLSVKGQSYPTLGIAYRSRLGNYPMYIRYSVNPTNSMGTHHLFGVELHQIKATR
jgi:hypothetical protein